MRRSTDRYPRTRALAAELQAVDDLLEPTARASFQALVDAPDVVARREAWQRIEEGFAALTSDPRAIDALKQTILDLAVRGLLVPQDPRDEPASMLLERVSRERQRLEAAQPGRRRGTLLGLCPDEIPEELPPGWEWVRLDSIADIASGVTKGRNLSGSDVVSLPYLRVTNVQRGYLDLAEVKDIEIKQEEIAKYLLEPDDLLLTEGGDADKLGRSATWTGEISPCIHQNHIFRARMYSQGISPEWVMLCTNSRYRRAYFLESAKQTTNLASINMTQLRHFPVAVPPQAEQRRVLAQLAYLDGLASHAETELDELERARTGLLYVILSSEDSSRAVGTTW